MKFQKFPVPVHLFRPEFDVEEVLENLAPVFESGWTGLGNRTQIFEEKFASTVGAKYCVGMNSATSALKLAYKIAGIKEKAAVLTTPITFVSTNTAILENDGVIIWCDVNPETLHLDFDYFIRKYSGHITPKAITVVHYGGLPMDMNNIYDYARKHDIWVIEDAAHAAGATYLNGAEKVGCCPYEKCLTVFSFHAVKNLPMGDGGCITTNSEEVKEKLIQLRWLGIDRSTFDRTINAENKGYNWVYNVPDLGFKAHMNDVQATIGLSSLQHLEYRNQLLRIKATLYSDKLHWGEGVVKAIGNRDVKELHCSSHHLFAVRVPELRDECLANLNTINVFPGVHYIANHLFPVFGRFSTKLPIADIIWKNIISLPMHRFVTPKIADTIIDVIESTIKGEFEI